MYVYKKEETSDTIQKFDIPLYSTILSYQTIKKVFFFIPMKQTYIAVYIYLYVIYLIVACQPHWKVKSYFLIEFKQRSQNYPSNI